MAGMLKTDADDLGPIDPKIAEVARRMVTDTIRMQMEMEEAQR